MLNLMVQRSEVDELDGLFAALSDRVRRGVIAELAGGPVTVSELARSAGMTVTGMAKHLKVLEQVGLVSTEKVGRSRYCQIGGESLDTAMVWIDRYQHLWQRRLDSLEAFFNPAKVEGDQS